MYTLCTYTGIHFSWLLWEIEGVWEQVWLSGQLLLMLAEAATCERPKISYVNVFRKIPSLLSDNQHISSERTLEKLYCFWSDPFHFF